MKKNKTIIVVSPGNSGGGAIHDYLLSRNDFTSPFFGEEFRLIVDPYGIENLFQNFYKNFSLNNSSEAFYQFKKYCYHLSKLKLGKVRKLIYGKKFYKESINYLNSIQIISYRGLPQFKSIGLDLKNEFILKFKRKYFGKKNHEHNLYKMSIPVDKKLFIYETKRYLKKICLINKTNKNVVLDQATNFWNPDIAFKYFDNLKIVLVTRDPRSIFYSMKSRASNAYPGYDIKKFVKWYQEIMSIRKKLKKKYKDKRILEIQFENFINNFESEKNKIEKFLGTKKEYLSSFDFQKTKKNVYKAKYLLTKSDQKFIEKKLKKYLQW